MVDVGSRALLGSLSKWRLPKVYQSRSQLFLYEYHLHAHSTLINDAAQNVYPGIGSHGVPRAAAHHPTCDRDIFQHLDNSWGK